MTASTGTPSARSKQRWTQAGLHNAFLPSGYDIELRFPNLPALIYADMVPQQLQAAAIREVERGDTLPLFLKAALGLTTPVKPEPSTAEEVKEAFELGCWLVTQMVIDPEITIADLNDTQIVPSEDRDFLILLAARARAHDARGRRLGVIPLDELEPFPSQHGCKPDCPSCKELQQALSTSRVLQL